MTTEFFQRIRKEFTLTLTGAHEAVLAVSERVNRKVQILKLHWQASSIIDHIEAIQQETGAFLAEHLLRDRAPSAQAPHRPPLEPDHPEIAAKLPGAASRIRLLKHDLQRIDVLTRELETEALSEDLRKIQHDLCTRSATVERIVVPAGSSGCGRTVAQLDLRPSVRVAAVLRGPALLTEPDSLLLRAGDIILLVGPRDELKNALPALLAKQRARA
jgi:K+/H+ antiporter YhaU regulatory subunit KhtT